MRDDYLWDKSGEVDPEIARVERALATFRHDAAPPVFRSTRRSSRAAAWIAAAALVTLAIRLPSPEGERSRAPARVPHRLLSLEGVPRVVTAGGQAKSDALRIGDEIVTGPGDRARLMIADIGSVALEPQTRLRIVDDLPHSAEGGYSLYLTSGTVRAAIIAAPRVFQVGTPAGIAVDLGCVYRATVLQGGETLLSVTSGAVSFESEGRRALVPAGASCVARPDVGPGAAFWDDRDPAFRRAATELDLDYVIDHAEARDTLTLWHFLLSDDPGDRGRALKGIDRLIGLPNGIDPARILAGDEGEIETLRHGIDWRW